MLVLALLVCVRAQASDEREGRCVGVTDGDTITVLFGEQPVRVRLEGIDAPERGQPYSASAKRHLSALVFDEAVRVRVVELDRYGRVVGRVLAGNVDTSVSLVESGLAWHYTRYSDDPELAAAEIAARAAERNLWSLRDPLPPWTLREERRAVRSPSENEAVVYHGNRRSRVYHAPSCRHYDCKNCTVVFATQEDAIDAGFRPDRACTE
jgi:endonuclease YncB( thermonuclease family)